MPIRSITWNPKEWAPLFFTIWTGQTLSWVGSAVAQFGLIRWITAQIGSATILAIATLISMLPGVLLGPLASALIDRWDRRIVMLVADVSPPSFATWSSKPTTKRNNLVRK